MTDLRLIADDARVTSLYVAGPMRGYPDFNFPAFDLAADRLRLAGFSIFSPAERDRTVHGDDVNLSPTGDLADFEAKGGSLRQALAADMDYISLHADGIAVLPGWEASKGALVETALAEALNLPVAPVEDWLASAGVTFYDLEPGAFEAGQPGAWVAADTSQTGVFELDEAHGAFSTMLPPPARRVLTNREAIDDMLGEHYATLPSGLSGVLRTEPLDDSTVRKMTALFGIGDADTDLDNWRPSAAGETLAVSASGGAKGTKPFRYDLVPTAFEDQVALLFAAGATKYEDHNWRRGYPLSLSIAAAYRHLGAIKRGEDYDQNSSERIGQPVTHAAAVAFHMAVIIEHLTYPEEYGEYDDRYRRC